jgi:hypothetical protein
MLAALRFRRAQTVVVVVLAALVTACLVLAPLYTRALEQATVRTLLGNAPIQDSGLRLSSTSSTNPADELDPDALSQLLPETIKGYFGTAVPSTAVDVRRMPLAGQPGGRLLNRAGMCEHVRFTEGQCPTAAREVAVTPDQARVYETRVGGTIDVAEFDGAVSTLDAAPRTTLKVVGVYEPSESPYWFGDRLSGHAAQKLGFDVMLTPLQTLTDPVTSPKGTPAPWFQHVYANDWPLVLDRVGIDQIGVLGSTVAGLVQYPMGVERAASHASETITVSSDLTGIADEVRVGSEQAAITVPLLMAQMALLLVCVLWLVLVSAADQRRGEVAVARLRGRGSRGARRLLLGETLPPVVIGVPLGALLGVVLSTFARNSVLTSEPPFEVPVAAVVALVAALVLMVGLAVLSVRRVSRDPVADLIRSVPPRRTGVRLGVLEAMLVAAAAAAFIALVTGSVQGPVGQIAPTLLALAVGVVAARVLAWLFATGGRRLLKRGRPPAGAALLTSSRRGTTRWLVPVVTVALSIVVVSVDALAVGARNWTGRAQAEVGAVSVLTLGSADLAAVTAALRTVDPGAAHVTPVALVSPGGQGGTTTVGVVPDAFGRLALWPGVSVGSIAWDKLTAPTVPPLVLKGTRVTFHVSAPGFEVVTPAIRPAPDSLSLALRVVRSDGIVDTIPLGTLPDKGIDADQATTVTCADGCRITGIGVQAPSSTAAVTGSVTLSMLTVDGQPVELGDSGAWRDTAAEDVVATGSYANGALTVRYANNGADKDFLPHASVPDVVTALTTPAAAPSAAGATFGGSYVDGTSLLLTSGGSVPFVPGGPPSAGLVNIDNLLAQGWRGRGSATVAAYLDTRDPAVMSQVTNGLAQQGIPVTATTYADDVAAAYGRSAAAWSLQLALAVGLLSLVVGAAGIIVLASTSRRARTRDYAVLRLVGQRPRSLTRLAELETVPVIVISALLGVGVGLWAGPAAVSLVPLFTSPPPTFPVDLATAWLPAVVAGVVGLVALTVVGFITSRRIARRASLERLRDTV